jgi:hypothetical protein
MLGRPMTDQIWAALHDHQPYDPARHVAALRALPASWERERVAQSAAEKHEASRKRASGCANRTPPQPPSEIGKPR